MCEVCVLVYDRWGKSSNINRPPKAPAHMPAPSDPASSTSSPAFGTDAIGVVRGRGDLRVVEAWQARGGPRLSRPLFLHTVPAGFPSPADDYVEKRLDINEALVNDEESTFFVRVADNSMIGAGIHDGDILIVDRSVEPAEGDVVIAVLGGELTVKRYEVRSGKPYLVPEAEGHGPIPVREGQELRVWGVAQHVIHEVS